MEGVGDVGDFWDFSGFFLESVRDFSELFTPSTRRVTNLSSEAYLSAQICSPKHPFFSTMDSAFPISS